MTKLNWIKDPSGSAWRAESPLGIFSVVQYEDERCWRVYGPAFVSHECRYDTEDDAKGAAQVAYRRHVAELLRRIGPTLADDEVRLLREQLRSAADDNYYEWVLSADPIVVARDVVAYSEDFHEYDAEDLVPYISAWQRDAAIAELRHVSDCFDAAEAEGLTELLERADQREAGSLPDVVGRRLRPAQERARRWAESGS